MPGVEKLRQNQFEAAKAYSNLALAIDPLSEDAWDLKFNAFRWETPESKSNRRKIE
jgi:hypothetical protein